MTDRGPIRILIVDDHPLLREGIAALLAGQSDLKLIAECSNGREAIVTRDPAGYPDAPLPVIDPAAALGWLLAQ